MANYIPKAMASFSSGLAPCLCAPKSERMFVIDSIEIKKKEEDEVQIPLVSQRSVFNSAFPHSLM